MKKYFYIATIAAFMLSGCEDFLDTENYKSLQMIDLIYNRQYEKANLIKNGQKV